MNLQELLAANPAAKAEYDAAITTATANGVTTGKEAMQATVKAVAPFLANASYPKQVGEMAVKVLTGEQTAANLTALVATADMMKEMQASSGGAQGTQEGGDVAAQQAAALAASKAGMISDETALQAEITALKEVA